MGCGGTGFGNQSEHCHIRKKYIVLKMGSKKSLTG